MPFADDYLSIAEPHVALISISVTDMGFPLSKSSDAVVPGPMTTTIATSVVVVDHETDDQG